MNTHSIFARALLNPEASLPSGIITRSGADPMRRFSVYRNNVVTSLIDAMGDAYPVVSLLVGEDFFRAMAHEFVCAHPPRSPVMVHYGEGFADFISRFSPAESIPYLADIARLEWQRVVSWHAIDMSPLAAEDVETLLNRPEQLAQSTWTLHPTAALLQSKFSIVSVWAAHQLPSAAAIESALAKTDPNMPESALVIRCGLDVLVLGLTYAEASFVESLLSGDSLQGAAERALIKAETFDLSLMLRLLLQSGALVGFECPEN
jgi:hypothetical protein